MTSPLELSSTLISTELARGPGTGWHPCGRGRQPQPVSQLPQSFHLLLLFDGPSMEGNLLEARGVMFKYVLRWMVWRASRGVESAQRPPEPPPVEGRWGEARAPRRGRYRRPRPRRPRLPPHCSPPHAAPAASITQELKAAPEVAAVRRR